MKKVFDIISYIDSFVVFLGLILIAFVLFKYCSYRQDTLNSEYNKLIKENKELIENIDSIKTQQNKQLYLINAKYDSLLKTKKEVYVKKINSFKLLPIDDNINILSEYLSQKDSIGL